jgi:hypothetical protein
MNATNAMMIITPYRSGGTWVFDDPNAGLVAEPFVSGAPAMIDQVIEVAGIEPSDARRDGVRLLFSANPFPGYQKEALRVREDFGGNWYRFEEPDLEGWLCPAMFHYFDEAPERLYVRAEPLVGGN